MAHKKRKKAEVERTAAETAAEWNAVGSLLLLGAKLGERLGVAVEHPPIDLVERLAARGLLDVESLRAKEEQEHMTELTGDLLEVGLPPPTTPTRNSPHIP